MIKVIYKCNLVMLKFVVSINQCEIAHYSVE
jgi:hypothetical protein